MMSFFSRFKKTKEHKKFDPPGTVIDVRTKKEYDQGHLTETDYHWDILSGEFQENVDSLDKKETYYLYCRSGNRSGKAAQYMKENGFENVHNAGGYKDLVKEGHKSET